MIDYQITDVSDHSVMKLDVLDLIDNMASKELTTTGYHGKHNSIISNTNWDDKTDIKGEIWPYFLTSNDQINYFNSIVNKFPDRKWNRKTIDVSWFNQYYANSGSEHPWHHHAKSICEPYRKNWCKDFTNIYYVELDDKSLTTILKDPETDEEIIPDVKEGQILTFAADILHKSPRNFTDSRKTVISFNVNFR
tara:strand:+ start:583 stop:1161 length:579 start_codon:yes stop_codon:yes gene_type:complete